LFRRRRAPGALQINYLRREDVDGKPGGAWKLTTGGRIKGAGVLCGNAGPGENPVSGDPIQARGARELGSPRES